MALEALKQQTDPKVFEPDIWAAIARHLLRPPVNPSTNPDAQTGQGDLLSLIKVSKVSTHIDLADGTESLRCHNSHPLQTRRRAQAFQPRPRTRSGYKLCSRYHFQAQSARSRQTSPLNAVTTPHPRHTLSSSPIFSLLETRTCYWIWSAKTSASTTCVRAAAATPSTRDRPGRLLAPVEPSRSWCIGRCFGVMWRNREGCSGSCRVSRWRLSGMIRLG